MTKSNIEPIQLHLRHYFAELKVTSDAAQECIIISRDWDDLMQVLLENQLESDASPSASAWRDARQFSKDEAAKMGHEIRDMAAILANYDGAPVSPPWTTFIGRHEFLKELARVFLSGACRVAKTDD